jgi:alpha-tubulin suppressor-like RCC1 family protein
MKKNKLTFKQKTFNSFARKQILFFAFAFLSVSQSILLKAQKMSGGYSHAVYVCSSGAVNSLGTNTSGQLGIGNTTNTNTPVSVGSLSGITAVSSGSVHTLYLKNDGTVWASGNNSFGQLGDGTGIDKISPVQITSLSGITSIAAGYRHSLFLKSDGTVWVCGWNNHGQLGDGTNTNKNAPVQISSLGTNNTAISAGYAHSLFLKNDGTVRACGYNLEGELGDGTIVNKNTPVQTNTVTGITAIVAGAYHSLFLKNNSTVWSCGWNNHGQLGQGNLNTLLTPVQINALSTSTITAIAAGYAHSLFLKNDGTVRACGYNTEGELGDNTNTQKTLPVAVSTLTNVTEIAGGSYQSFFKLSNGTFRTCGWNNDGQIGDGTTVDKFAPVQPNGLCGVFTSLNENIEAISFLMYPNPASTILTLKTEQIIETIAIYNTLGALVLETKETTFSVEKLNSGIYVVQVKTEKGTGMSRFIKE